MGDDVEDFYKDFTKRGQKTAKSISGHIEDQPIMSLLIAFSVGYVMINCSEVSENDGKLAKLALMAWTEMRWPNVSVRA